MVEELKRIGSPIMKTRIRSVIAILVIVWAGLYLWKYSFTRIELINSDAKFIAGFVTGTMVATIIGFYFGSSEKKEVEDNNVEEI